MIQENNQSSVDEIIENKEPWERHEFQDTASSGQEKEAKVFTFYRIEEEGERYCTPCYVGGLHAYDGEINLKYDKNLISNEFVVKLCLEYEEKNGEKLVKRELSFMRLAKGIADFRIGIVTIHPELDPFLDNSKETKKFEDAWDHLLDINFGDIPEINEAVMYKKILDWIVMDKIKLDGEIKKEEEEAIKHVKREALKEKEDPRASIIPIRLEAKINLNAFAGIGSDINVMPY
nr:hypothetical protein [Tanacetum cinerariifolium]